MTRRLTVLVMALLVGCTQAPPQPARTCVDFAAYKDGQKVKGSLSIDELSFSSGPTRPLVFQAAPRGGVALKIVKHVVVTTPGPDQHFEVTYVANSPQPIRVQTYAENGAIQQSLALAAEPRRTALVQRIDDPRETRTVGFSGGGDQGLLVRFCVVK